MIIFTLLLASCAITSKFDNIEYNRVVLLTQSLKTFQGGYCPALADTQFRELKRLENITNGFELYTRYIPNNTEVQNVAKSIKNDVQQLLKHYSTNEYLNLKYCQIKLKIMHRKAERILKAIGQKDR